VKNAKTTSKAISTDALAVDPATVKAANKRTPKKPSIAESVKATGTEDIAKAEESEVTDSAKKGKKTKAKVIRDSFSFPEQDYVKISELKKTCMAAGIHVKKGEILRAGLHMLTKLSLSELKQAVGHIEKVQTGRPKSSK
jgi:hypothetical protein